MEWVSSGGGPLIALPEHSLSSWLGASDDDDSDEPTDYDRASDVDEYAGLIEVGAAHALVFGDDPAPATFLPDKRLFIRRLAAENDVEILARLDESLAKAVWQEAGTWNVESVPLLFDAAFAGSEIASCGFLRVQVAPGRYVVSAAYVEPSPETWLVLVKLSSI